MRGDRPGRQRDAEQLGQRLRGALLGQELPDVQVHDDRGDPRPVLHRRLRALRGGALGPVPAAAFPLDQLMLGHLTVTSRQVEDLAALHPGDRPSRQARPAPAAAGRLMAHLPVRPGHLRQRRALMPVLPARLAAALLPQRPRLGGGLPSPSLDGGLEEFRGVCLSRASSSAIRSRACASSRPPAPAQPATRPAPRAARPPARPAPHPRNQRHHQAHPDTTARQAGRRQQIKTRYAVPSSTPSRSHFVIVSAKKLAGRCRACLHLPGRRREAGASGPMADKPPLPGRRPIAGQHMTDSRMAPPPGSCGRCRIDSSA